LCWISSHIGITGNEEADQTAKSALNLYSDMTSIKNSYCQVATPLA